MIASTTVRRRVGLADRLPVVRRGAWGASVGFVVAGLFGALVGGLAAALADPVLRNRDARRRDAKLDEQVAWVCGSIAAAVRSGANLPQALQVAAVDASEPIRGTLDAAIQRLEVGAPVHDAVESIGRNGGTAAARLLTEALLLGRAAAADLPAVLDSLGASLTERQRIARDRHAVTAQARLSAMLVASMPLAFYAMVGSGAREQVGVLLGDPAGWVLAGSGLFLEAAGLLWMRSMMARPA